MLSWDQKKKEWEIKLVIEGEVVYQGYFKNRKDAIDKYNLEFQKAIHEEVNDDL